MINYRIHHKRFGSAHTRVLVVIVVFMAALFTGAPPSPAQAAAGKYIVNSLLDTPDTNPGDNKCKDSSGKCTLRAAIQEANAHAGKDTIQFSGLKAGGVPTPWVISPSAALDAITGPVVIDAVTGTGAVCKNSKLKVRLDGSAILGGVSGLWLQNGASGSTVKGLVITSFPHDGILIDQASKVVVQCNLLGVQEDGETPNPNLWAGVEINGNGGKADQNVIGGSAANRNIISGNTNYGVLVTNITGTGMKGNKIQANYIGTDKTGLEAVGNNNYGVIVEDAPKTIIGGTTKLGNVVSGNGNEGIRLTSASGSLVQGNIIGLDKAGLGDLGNAANGVFVAGSSNVTIGGKSPSYGNVVSGNDNNGIHIQGSSDNVKVQSNIIGLNKPGTLAAPNGMNGMNVSSSTNTLIGGTSAAYRNVISGNSDSGIVISDAATTGTLVQGNYIGTSKSGLVRIPNQYVGVLLYNTSGNTIGGSSAGARNVISGNASDGIRVDNGPAGNTILGNYIGLNAKATAALENSGNGVNLIDCVGCLVGGSTSAGQRNLISGNGVHGISMSGGSGNQIYGNNIGVNSKGTAAMPNHGYGISLSTSSGNFIGSGAAGAMARNVISGNASGGIALTTDSGDTIQGNVIGLDAAGSKALGNGGYGILVQSSANTVIGGVGAAYRNIVSANGLDGIYMVAAGTAGTQIKGNIIGLNAAGTAGRGNGDSGISINQAPGNTIGGDLSTGEGNVISGNEVYGVSISTASSNVIQGNLIGVSADGKKGLGNSNSGVYLYAAPSTTIGGPTTGVGSGAGNIISGNRDGMYIGGASDNTFIRGNWIGANMQGTAAIPNLQYGVNLTGGSNITIGGSQEAYRNLISGNGQSGINVNASLTGVIIQRNQIGTGYSTFDMLGNADYGIRTTSAVTIANNIIAYNTDGGIRQYSVAMGGGANNCLFYNLSGEGLNHAVASTPNFTGNWWGWNGDPVNTYNTAPDYLNPGHQNVYFPAATPTVTHGSLPGNCPVGFELIDENQDMEDDLNLNGIPDGWTPKGVTVSLGEGQRSDSFRDGSYSMKMIGGGTTSISQTVTTSGEAGDSLILSVYTQGMGVSGAGVYQASVKIGSKTFNLNIPVDAAGSTLGWQHHVLGIKAPSDFTSAVVTLTFSKPYGSVWWDCISLVRLALA